MVKKKYTGILNEPMNLHAVSSMATALQGLELTKDDETANEQNMNQLTSRMKSLYEFYGIQQFTPDSELSMVLALASAHVPGFQWKDPLKKKGGRPSKWKGDKSAELYADVKYLESTGLSALSACHHLTTNQKYSNRYKGETKKNLYRRYQEAPSNMVSFLQTMMTIEKKKGAPFDKWMIEVYSLCGKA